jgi:hypothetical protein
LKSRVQRSEVKSGGAAGRNCAALDITQGVKPLTVDDAGKVVGTYTPACVTADSSPTTSLPSEPRSSRIPALPCGRG